MLNEKNFKEMINIVLIGGLFILAILVLKPIIIPILLGVLLAYIFYPLYAWMLKKLKNENLTVSLICLELLILVFVFMGVLIKYLSEELVNLYITLQQVDLASIAIKIMPKFLSSSEMSKAILDSLNSSASKLVAGSISKFGDLILNLPIILLYLFVMIFVFYFALKDGKRGIDYIKSLSPLKKEVQEEFFKQFRDITNSVLIGQFVIGILQGITAGIGYFIFGVPKVIPLTILTIIMGVIPLIGAWLVWVPVDIYLFAIGKTEAGIGLLIYGIILISWADNLVRPLIVSKKTQINLAIIIIGMTGGIFAFGFLGLIIGPLVLAYVLLIIELYRKKTIDETVIFKEKKESEK